MLKTKQNFILFFSKSGCACFQEVPHNYSNFTWKLLVFWKSGRLREVVATGGSTVLILLYYKQCAKTPQKKQQLGRLMNIQCKPVSFICEELAELIFPLSV